MKIPILCTNFHSNLYLQGAFYGTLASLVFVIWIAVGISPAFMSEQIRYPRKPFNVSECLGNFTYREISDVQGYSYTIAGILSMKSVSNWEAINCVNKDPLHMRIEYGNYQCFTIAHSKNTRTYTVLHILWKGLVSEVI